MHSIVVLVIDVGIHKEFKKASIGVAALDDFEINCEDVWKFMAYLVEMTWRKKNLNSTVVLEYMYTSQLFHRISAISQQYILRITYSADSSFVNILYLRE